MILVLSEQGEGAEDAYNRFNFNILTPLYQNIKSFVEDNFDTKEELSKELEGMKLEEKRLQQYGSEFERSALNQYIWELENKFQRARGGANRR